MVVEEAAVRFGELTTHFNSPELAAGGVAAGIAIAGLSMVKSHLEARNVANGQEEAALADPFIAERADLSNKRTHRAERLGALFAAVAVTAGLAQAAGPHTYNEKSNGVASVLINATYAENATTMKSTTGKPESLLNASIDAVSYVATKTNVPFQIIVEGASAPIVETVQPNKKPNVTSTQEAIVNEINSLNNTFRDGEDMAAAVGNATAFGHGEINKIVMLTPSLSSTEAGAIKSITEKSSTNKQYSVNTKLEAIAIGNNQGNTQIGINTFETAAEPQSFKGVVPGEVPATASVATLETDLVNDINGSKVAADKKNTYIYLDIAIVDTILLAGLSLGRRFSGLSKLIKKSTRRS